MIRLLAKIGRLNSVVIITIVAAAAAVAVASGAIQLLNHYGLGLAIRLDPAIPLAAGVSLVVVAPISWVLIGMTLRIYRIEEKNA